MTQLNPSIILSGENVGDQIARAQAPAMNAMRMQAAQQEMQGAQQDRHLDVAAKLARGVLSSGDPASAYPRALQTAQAMGLDVRGLPQQWSPEVGEQLQMLSAFAGMPKDERTEFERIIANLPPEEQMEAMRRKAGIIRDPELRTVGSDLVEIGPNGPRVVYQDTSPRDPMSNLGRLHADYQAGRIDKPTYEAAIAKETAQSGGIRVSPDGTVEIGGVPGEAPVAVRTEAIKGHNAYQSIMKGLDDFEGLIETGGSAVLPGAEKDAVLDTRRSLQLQMKELFNLGVLNGPDLMLMDQLLIDPTDLVNAGMDAVGVASIRDRGRENIKRLRKMMKDLVEPKLKSVGGSLGSEAEQSGGFDVKALSDDQLRQMLGL